MLKGILQIRPKVPMPQARQPMRKVECDMPKVLDKIDPLVIDTSLTPLVIKSNIHMTNKGYQMRRGDLIKEYGGNVVLLKPHEELLGTSQLEESVRELIEVVEKRRYKDAWDNKSITEIEEFKKLKALISTK